MEQQGGGVWRMMAAMTIAGTVGLFVLFSGQSPQTVVWFRCLIGAAALFAAMAWSGAWQPMDKRAALWLLLGAAALIGNWLCLFWSFTLAGISVATVVYHMQPFFLILLAALTEREFPALHKLPWLALAFAGVALSAGIDAASAPEGMAMGVLLALAAAFLYALATLATRKLNAYAPVQIAALQLAIGVLALAPLARLAPFESGLQTWSSLLILGLVHTGLMYPLMYGAFQRLPADAVATLTFIYPVVAILTDLAVFGTALSALQVAGLGMILASVIANQRLAPVRPKPAATRPG